MGSNDDVMQYSSRQLGSVFGSSLVGFSLDGYNNVLVVILLPFIAETLHLQPWATASIISGQLLAGLFGGIVFGWIGDVIGRKNVLMASIGLYSVGAVLSAMAHGYTFLLVARIVTGLGLGGEWGAGMVLFTESWSPKRRGFGASMIQGSNLLGQSLAGFVSGWAVLKYGPSGWHVAMLTGMIPILLAIFVRVGLPESKLWQEYRRMERAGELPQEKQQEGIGLIAIFKNGRNIWLLVRGLLLVGGFFTSVFSFTIFMPTLVIKVFHAGPKVFGELNAYILWISILFYLIIGWLSDRWGRKRAFVAPALVMLVGAVLFYIVAQTSHGYPGSLTAWPIFWTYLVVQIGSASSGLFGPWLAEIFPVEMRNTATSFCYNIGKGSSAIVPVLVVALGVGTMARGVGLVALIGAVVMVVFGLLLPETRRRAFTVIDYGVAGESPGA